MLFRNGTWDVFSSERGTENGLERYDDIDDACKRILFLLSEDTQEYEQMAFYYLDQQKKRDKRISSNGLYEAVKRGISKITSSAAAF